MHSSMTGKAYEVIREDFKEKSELLCYYCEAVLGLEFDYTCLICGALTCDKHNDVCQADDEEGSGNCDLVTCHVCAEEHGKSHHSESGEV